MLSPEQVTERLAEIEERWKESKDGAYAYNLFLVHAQKDIRDLLSWYKEVLAERQEREKLPNTAIENNKSLNHAVLCYVDGCWAHFTTCPLDKQWGDDWNDAPYENNGNYLLDSPIVAAQDVSGGAR